jgi:hypothetical protein
VPAVDFAARIFGLAMPPGVTTQGF